MNTLAEAIRETKAALAAMPPGAEGDARARQLARFWRQAAGDACAGRGARRNEAPR